MIGDHDRLPPVLIGIVGYSPVIDAYPLGPTLMAALQGKVAGRDDVMVENMTWGPIHVVQRFQDEGAVRPRRVVLIGAAATSRVPGRVRAFRWTGGDLPAAAMQERIYEAVTGVVDIENTLVIGSHFKVWPDEIFSVEVDLPADTFGNMVIADSLARKGEGAATDHGFSPQAVITELAELAATFAIADGATTAEAKSAADCAKVESFTRNRIAVDA